MKKKKQFKNFEDDRYGLFMTENSYNLQILYGRNYLKTNNAQEVFVHKINILESKSHNLYGQTKPKDKKYLPPIRLSVMINIAEESQEYYGDTVEGISRDDTGNLKFGVYLDELNEKKIEIDRGDLIEYNMSGEKDRYYEVENANLITDATNKTIGGFKPYFKTILAVPVKEDVTPFLNETKGN